MLRYQDLTTTPAGLRALAMLNPDDFAYLVPVFDAAFLACMQTTAINGVRQRNRCDVFYNNSSLAVIEDKLFFSLVHFILYLIREVLEQSLGMVPSDFNKWLKLLSSASSVALECHDVLPSRLASVVVNLKAPTGEDTPFLS